MVFSGGLEVAVEHGGVEVQAVGPCHGAAFWINLDLREVLRIVKGSENRSMIRSGQELKFSGDAVVEGEPNNVVSRAPRRTRHEGSYGWPSWHRC